MKKSLVLMLTMIMILGLIPPIEAKATSFANVHFTYNFDLYTGKLTSIDVSFDFSGATYSVASGDWALGIFTCDVGPSDARQVPNTDSMTLKQALDGQAQAKGYWKATPICYTIGSTSWNAGSGSRSLRLNLNSDQLNSTTRYYCHIMFKDGNGIWIEGAGAKGYTSDFTEADVKAALEALHSHDWNYTVSADGTTLTALCGATDAYPCPYKANALTVKINADNKLYMHYGNVTAEVSGSLKETFENVTKYSMGSIEYFKEDSLTSKATTSPETVARDVGYHMARVVFTKSGSTTYTITKNFYIYPETLNYETEPLNQDRTDSEGNIIHAVTGNSTSNLVVELDSSGDTTSIYKLASMEWNSNNNDYDDLEWVSEVKSWLTSSASFADGHKYNTSAYASPYEMRNVTSAVSKSFYEDLLVNSTKVIGTDTGKVNALYSDVASNGGTEGAYTTTFSNLSFGTYAVITKNSAGTAYAPIVIHVIPEKTGPNASSYCVKYQFEVSLKESPATLTKTINTFEADVVAFGELVNFDVEFTLPSLSKDRVTNSANGYTLNIEDKMAEGFSLVNSSNAIVAANASGQITDLSGIKLTYTYEDGGEDVTKELPTGNYAYNYFTTTANGNTVTGDSVSAEKGTEYNTELNGKYYVAASAPVYTIAAKVENKETVITVTFNNQALKAWIAATTEDSPISSVSGVTFNMTYKAKVNNKIKVGSEENYNKAKITYEKSLAGDTAYVEDEVKAYTYAIQLIKVDGDSVGKEKVDYLASAKFALYKNICSFKGTYTIGENNVSSETIAIYKDAEGNAASASDFKTFAEYKADSNAIILDSLAENNAGTIYDIYVRIDTVEAGKEKSNVFTSVASAAGVTIIGIDAGKYIIEEVEAPENYNDLAENIYLEINRLSAADAQLYSAGSYKSFKNLDDELIEDGVLSVTVLNYKGLTLPSTGGMGTLLFTILGIILMVFALMIVLIRSRKKSYTDYMM